MFHVRAFPDQIGPELWLPNVAELLCMTMYGQVSADELYKHGNDFHRRMLDSAPITNKKKYVVVASQIQFLSPKVRSIGNLFTKAENEWHFDGPREFRESQDTVHLLLNDCSALTEFNEEAFDIDIPNDMKHPEFVNYLNYKESRLKGKKMPPNRFVTFNNHIHRPTTPSNREFRFTFRILETDTLEPRPIQYGVVRANFVTSRHDNAETPIPNLERDGNKLTIYLT